MTTRGRNPRREVIYGMLFEIACQRYLVKVVAFHVNK